MNRTDEHSNLLHNLSKGAESLACGRFLQQMGTLERCRVYTDAGYDRMMRKHRKIMQIYEESCKSWDQTFYKVMLRSIDVGANRSAYEQLADTLPYRVVLREQESKFRLEALLLGVSGLLCICKEDEYTSRLRQEFRFLKSKHSLETMPVSVWHTRNSMPYNHPVLRLVQIATLINNMPFITNSILDCRSCMDVERLFCVSASAYWTTHLFPTLADTEHTLRLGVQKSYLLGINLVAQLQYAYGVHIGNQALTYNSISLLESLPPENNTYTRRWAKYGVKANNAFESQALLQIATEYCAQRRCEECHLAKVLINRLIEDKYTWQEDAEGYDD
ncbi:MAG: DUF2851 family protein [Alistipes sp.]|nr:DUF2851 family protein [Alistipes sp.]